jgi:hypothetical protein
MSDFPRDGEVPAFEFTFDLTVGQFEVPHLIIRNSRKMRLSQKLMLPVAKQYSSNNSGGLKALH